MALEWLYISFVRIEHILKHTVKAAKLDKLEDASATNI